MEDFNDTVPYRLTLMRFCHRNALQVSRFRTMQVANHVAQFFDVRHATASSNSRTLQKDCSTPAAIAGVQRSVLWRRTKL